MKRLFSLILTGCFIIGILCFAPTVSAADIKQGIVEVSKVNANVGEEIVVPVQIKENPGIMAITISVTYDPAALEYFSYYYGNVFNDYTVAAHPDRKLIRVVICETRNKTKNGNIISLRFKVKKEAKAQFYPITVEYSRGDFCNWDLDKIMPEVVAGGVEVAFNGENCPHKNYGEWTVVTEPVCEEVGVKVRVCDFCGHNDYKEIKAIGHTYSDVWTVDKPATAESDGTMSRYCIRCDDYVDRITFSLEQTEKEEIDNTIWEDFTDKETAEDIFEEQNPGKEPTKNSPSNKNESNSKPSADKDSSKDKVSSNTSSKDKTSSSTSSKGEKPNTSSKNEKPETEDNTSKGDADKSDETVDKSSSDKEDDSENASSDKASKPANTDKNSSSKDNKNNSSSAESEPLDHTQKPDEKNEDTSSKESILEQILPEIKTEEGESISVYQKLVETFPKFKTVINVARVLLIVLLIIIIL